MPRTILRRSAVLAGFIAATGVAVAAGTSPITGTAAPDVITGTAGADQINGLAGADVLRGDPGFSAEGNPPRRASKSALMTSFSASAAISPSERLALTGKLNNLDNENALYLVDPDGGNPTPVTGVGATKLLGGKVLNPSFSPDGTKIVFVTNSNSSNLDIANPAFRYQVVVKDLQADTYTVLSRTYGTTPEVGNGDSAYPVFSPDGERVAFLTNSTNLIPGDTNDDPAVGSDEFDVVIVDLNEPESMATATTNAEGEQVGGANVRPSFSPDGSRILLGWTASGVGNSPRVVVRELGIRENGRYLGAIVAEIPGALTGLQPFSPDGREIVIHTTLKNVPEDADALQDVYVATIDDFAASGRAKGSFRLVSANAEGTSDGASTWPVFSPDGTKVAFYSTSTQLVDGATSTRQAYIADLQQGSIHLLSRNPDPGDANANGGTERTLQFAPDGSFLLFDSLASNLAEGDTANTPDVFVVGFETSPGANDTLDGGPGDDLLIGGPGEDTAVYPGPRRRYDVACASGECIVTDLANLLADHQGTDLLRSVEQLSFDGLPGLALDALGPPNGSPAAGGAFTIRLAPGAAAGPFPIPADPDGDPVVFSHTSSGTLGLVNEIPGGAWVYASTGTSGSETFTVKASDPFGGEGVTTVTAVIGGPLAGDAGPDVIVGGMTVDTISGAGGADTLDGGLGNDLLDGGPGADVMIGGPGDDRFLVDDPADQVVEAPGQGRDQVSTALPYTLPANVEAVALTGGQSVGATGNGLANTLVGNGAANLLSGLSGNDVLAGLGGADTLQGGFGDDTLSGGSGTDTLSGGPGIDTASYVASPGAVRVNLGPGTGAAGDAAGDQLTGIENLVGSLRGDILVGSGGPNWLTGGAGADQLTGGRGADRFVYRAPGDSPAGTPDRILDFNVAEGDRIDLSAIDAKAVSVANEAFTYIGSAPFNGRRGELRFACGALLADRDGNRRADMKIVLSGVVIAPPRRSIMP